MSNFDLLRYTMAADQLTRRGLHDTRVVEAMCRVPREEFVPHELRSEAYDDAPQPIGYAQTISQPYTVAFMCQEAQLTGAEKVLEIGTGSGYGAAVLAELASVVHTIERIEPLYQDAQARLARLGCDNVHVHHGDGTLGLADEAPFDAIVVTAAPDHVPEPLVEQLGLGGRLVIPVGDYYQELLSITKTERGVLERRVIPVRFVPMTGEAEEPRPPGSEGP